MAIWKPRIDKSSRAIYQAVADAIEHDIDRGVLEAGERLPTHRALAGQLGVTAVTVTRAYSEAARRGLLESTVGRGTFVRARAGEQGGRSESLDLTRNIICGNEELELPRELTVHLRRVLQAAEYQFPPAGSARHRSAGAEWFARCGYAADAEQVLVTPGAQPALLAIIAALLRPGDRVLTEEMVYPGFRAVLALLGIHADAVSIDEHGLKPAALDAACRATGNKVLYCTPNFQNPTAVTMPEARRRELVAVARKHSLTIVEDDVYGFLNPSPIASLAARLPDQVCQIVSVTKALSPSLRLGFIAAPRMLMPRIESSLAAVATFTSTAAAEIFSLLLESGESERIVRRKQALVVRHQQLARRIFGDALGATSASSPHAWLTLPADAEAQSVAREAGARGYPIAVAEAFAVDRRKLPNAVRLSLGATPRTADLERALLTIAGIAGGTHLSSASVI